MKDYVAVNKQAYDLLADEYLARNGNSTEPLDELVGRSLKYAESRFSDIRMLEIGPGSGEVCAYVASRGHETTAIDVSGKILDNVRRVSPTTSVIEADILTHNLSPASYEFIYCGALVHLFTSEDAKELLKSIYDALVPGGILFINTTIHETSSEGYYEKHDYNQKVKRYRHKYTDKEFKELISSSGFQLVDQLVTDEDERGKYWLALICDKPVEDAVA